MGEVTQARRVTEVGTAKRVMAESVPAKRVEDGPVARR
jgi:hypothetical protein